MTDRQLQEARALMSSLRNTIGCDRCRGDRDALDAADALDALVAHVEQAERENAEALEHLRDFHHAEGEPLSETAAVAVEAYRHLRHRAEQAEAREAALREALEATTDRVEEELRLLERWAGEQNAGNAFAAQVRLWALSHLERRIPIARAAAPSTGETTDG